MKPNSLLLALAFLAAVAAAPAATLYVDAASTHPDPPYSFWFTAARTIQNAVDAAAPGDEVVVTNGVYSTGGKVVNGFTLTNRVAVDKPLSLRSVNGPEVTIIQGYQVPGMTNGDGAIRCVYLADGAILSGFALTNGATGMNLNLPRQDNAGGGVCCESTNALVMNCALRGNSAGGYGGGAFSGTLYNCSFILNSCQAGIGGGAERATLVNCTLARNSAPSGGGGGAAFCALNNCIIYDNTAEGEPNYSFSSVNYSCTTPMPTSGTGNITNEPAFVDLAGGNLRLQAGSPCINAGNNAYITSSTDLDGNERIVGGMVDMGAYEWVAAPTHYVSASSANPVAPYRSWSTAAAVIQDAVDAAAPGDEVVVTNGVYASGGRTVNGGVLTNRVAVDRAVSLRSVNGPEVTVIRGSRIPPDFDLTPAIRCVYLATGATLSGFTLTNGGTLNLGSNEIQSLGGGVYCASATVVVSSCFMAGNTAQYGGGVYDGTVNNCTLTGNYAYYGGGANLSTLNHCILTGNSSDQGSGGGAADSTLSNCTLTANSAGWGGGTYYGTLNHCTLNANSAQVVGGGACGGTLNHCALTGNVASFAGGGASGCTLNNCTLTDNSADMGGGAWFNLALNNCIIYYNMANIGPNTYGYQDNDERLNFCCTTPASQRVGTGNITNEPAFVDLAGGNLRLQAGSPCINAGYNAYATSGTDLDGHPRIAYGTVDIGAYEWSAPALSGSVTLEGFAGPAQNGTGNRLVSFKASDDTGRVLAAWDQELSFAGGTNGASVAGFTLTNPPPETTRLSAKTEWHLRKRLPVVVTNGQVVGNFTGASRLRAGDLDGSNLVEMEDYFLLAASWYQPGLAADLDGSGLVDIFDYFLLASHWYEAGDPE